MRKLTHDYFPRDGSSGARERKFTPCKGMFFSSLGKQHDTRFFLPSFRRSGKRKITCFSLVSLRENNIKHVFFFPNAFEGKQHQTCFLPPSYSIVKVQGK